MEPTDFQNLSLERHHSCHMNQENGINIPKYKSKFNNDRLSHISIYPFYRPKQYELHYYLHQSIPSRIRSKILSIPIPDDKPKNTPFQTFTLGLCVGVIHVIAGHPLDTIKTRLQTNSTHGLFRNLFNGIAPPLLTVPFSWSIYWSLYSKAMNFITNNDYLHLLNNENDILRYMTIFGCGALSGGVPCLILCPTDLIKCYAQKYHLSSINASKSIYSKFIHQTSDVIITSQLQTRTSILTLLRKGIYRGFVANLARDMPGMGMYFLCLEVCRNRINGYNDSLLIPFMCGTFNGTAYWIVGFPGDCIKSKIQTDFVLAKNIDEMQTASFIKNIRAHISNYGVRSLYKGFGVMMIRNPIVCGTAVVALETAQKYLDSFNIDK